MSLKSKTTISSEIAQYIQDNTESDITPAEIRQRLVDMVDSLVASYPTGVTGADTITNIMSLTTAEYAAIVTPDSATLYVITDAT